MLMGNKENYMAQLNFLTLKLTNRCNLNCYMCGQTYSRNEMEKEDLSFNLIKYRLSEMNDIGIYLFGGEPLIYNEFTSLIEFLRDKKFKVVISTNGVFLHRFTDDIIKNEVYELFISLDSYDADIYQKIRGKNVLGDVLNNLEYLIKKKKKNHSNYPRIGINFVILPDNFKKLVDFYEFINKNYPEVEAINFELPIVVNYDIGKRHELLLKQRFNCQAKSWEWFYNRISMFTKDDLSEISSQIKILKKKVKFSF
jgi:molybdenum cofactor biosynthesis enzyme MoaA